MGLVSSYWVGLREWFPVRFLRASAEVAKASDDTVRQLRNDHTRCKAVGTEAPNCADTSNVITVFARRVPRNRKFGERDITIRPAWGYWRALFPKQYPSQLRHGHI